jgi:hypothetical protein
LETRIEKATHIRADDTPDSVKVRLGVTIQKYDLVDIDILLAKWYEKKN